MDHFFTMGAVKKNPIYWIALKMCWLKYPSTKLIFPAVINTICVSILFGANERFNCSTWSRMGNGMRPQVCRIVYSCRVTGSEPFSSESIVHACLHLSELLWVVTDRCYPDAAHLDTHVLVSPITHRELPHQRGYPESEHTNRSGFLFHFSNTLKAARAVI